MNGNYNPFMYDNNSGAYQGFAMLANAIARKKKEGENTKALRNAVFGNNGGTLTKADPLADTANNVDKMDMQTGYGKTDEQIAADSAAYSDNRRKRIQDILHPNTYNALSDVNASRNYDDYDGILKAKMDYAQAEQLGDTQGMYAANAKAEAIRAQNPNLGAGFDTAGGADLLTAEQNLAALKRTQKLNDFVTGQGNYDYGTQSGYQLADTAPSNGNSTSATPAIGTALSSLANRNLAGQGLAPTENGNSISIGSGNTMQNNNGQNANVQPTLGAAVANPLKKNNLIWGQTPTIRF